MWEVVVFKLICMHNVHCLLDFDSKIHKMPVFILIHASRENLSYSRHSHGGECRVKVKRTNSWAERSRT